MWKILTAGNHPSSQHIFNLPTLRPDDNPWLQYVKFEERPAFFTTAIFCGASKLELPKGVFYLGEGCHVNWCWLGFPGVASWTKHGRLGVWGKGRMDEVVTKIKKIHLFPG